jgi:hypothetical protein
MPDTGHVLQVNILQHATELRALVDAITKSISAI